VEGVAAAGMPAEPVSTVVAALMAAPSMVEAFVAVVLPGEVAEPSSPEGVIEVVRELDMDRA
jgi:hypothetical protein